MLPVISTVPPFTVTDVMVLKSAGCCASATSGTSHNPSSDTAKPFIDHSRDMRQKTDAREIITCPGGTNFSG
ncbi:hypothetical protein ASNO1_42940 [Corallococcus caeni]|uniref:Uncharacterized protein n=1 Tax=Corallococcus caeni TaxID=3082388 RepID=A0ABQ6QWI2_9BACT|nr:hypothetical protein ASNO1_42940 [Corallococcus sp. NO1]